MQKYKVCIKETLERVIEVEAEGTDEAHLKARHQYYTGKVILIPDDYTRTEFIILE